MNATRLNGFVTRVKLVNDHKSSTCPQKAQRNRGSSCGIRGTRGVSGARETTAVLKELVLEDWEEETSINASKFLVQTTENSHMVLLLLMKMKK